MLQTHRLQLRPTKAAHAVDLFPYMSDASVTRFLAWEPHTDVAETAEVLSELASAHDTGRAFHWTVFEGEDACGLISLIDVRRGHRSWQLQRAEISYWIGPPHQGRGIATEATAAVVAEAFDRLSFHRLLISHTTANPASGAIPRKLGFRFIGTERDFFLKEGIWHDMNHYELVVTDWDRRKGLS